MILNEIVKFVVENYNYYAQHKDEIREYIKRHILYGTFDCIIKNGKIVACVRWNISPDGKTAHVLDLVIDKKHRGKLKIIKELIARNWRRFPFVETITFERPYKYGKRKSEYSIASLLKQRS